MSGEPIVKCPQNVEETVKPASTKQINSWSRKIKRKARKQNFPVEAYHDFTTWYGNRQTTSELYPHELSWWVRRLRGKLQPSEHNSAQPGPPFDAPENVVVPQSGRENPDVNGVAKGRKNIKKAAQVGLLQKNRDDGRLRKKLRKSPKKETVKKEKKTQ
ncbi:hypothetical protein XU18_1862 [Perkinsela sp. CCAP 1560/4]|nr:hypothetical protein XU18_1862 [Perkinsela sp. CCAP 1560/4]|eukprot:KNH07330.1 hypothetical protein XU18_1862 [Perkinsela sp. CCAP 1560/4]